MGEEAQGEGARRLPPSSGAGGGSSLLSVSVFTVKQEARARLGRGGAGVKYHLRCYSEWVVLKTAVGTHPFSPRGRRHSCAVCRLISLLCPCPHTAPSPQSGRVLLPQGCVIAALLCLRPSSGFSSEWFFKWPPRPHKFWLPICPLSAPTCSHLPFADPTPATQAPPCSWNLPSMLLHWCLFPLFLLLRMLLP